MKRLLWSFWSVALLVSFAGMACAQGNTRGTSKLVLKGQTVSVEYGRPALKGRTVEQLLGKLGPGDVWRLGADKSTTFSTGVDLAFGAVSIPKGEYSLWAQKAADGWKLVFNKQHGQWGMTHDAAQDLAATPLKETKGPKPEEMVTISLAKEGEGGAITIQWGEKVLSASFKAK
ncbi:MAG: DUF2911 domain-containing protein [Terriglobia bacterium]